MWDEITGSDGIVRQLQWTARVEGNALVTNSTRKSSTRRSGDAHRGANSLPDAMTLSQYLGTGVVSRGRMTITPSLTTRVSEHPYLHDEFDKEAVIQGIKNMQEALNVIPNITWVLPPPDTTVEDYVNNVRLTLLHIRPMEALRGKNAG